jgi:PAP2 superfamily
VRGESPNETTEIHPLRWTARNLHFAAALGLALGLPFALNAARFPIRFNWPQYVVSYWFVFGIRAILGAAIFYLVGCPEQFRRWLRAPRSTAPLGAQLAALAKRVGAVLLPAGYLFIGLIVVFSYNDIVAALKFNFHADEQLNRVDAWMLSGWTVSRLAHLVAAHVPMRTFDVMTVIYFLLFPALGSTLVFLALQCGAMRAIQFVGALMTAYVAVVGCFYLIPAVGPFVICADHFSVFPNAMKMYAGQYEYIEILKGYMAGHRPEILAPHYFAALPCMHIVQPMIALWFLRPWKRLAAIFVVFNIALVPCILLLEQHYLIDLIAAIPLIVVAIGLIDGFRPGRSS